MIAEQATWLNVASHLDPKFGGISKMLPEFCSAVSSTDACRVSLVGFCSDAERAAMQAEDALIVDTIKPGKFTWPIDSSWRRLSAKVAEADGIHVHGMWEEHTLAAVRAAKAAGKPYVFSAHGMLDRWALKNKGLKKAVYSSLVERGNVCGAACLHALTQTEASDYRRFGARNPIALIPNGVRIPARVDSKAFLSRFPHLARHRIVLFLGRVHFKKGLDLLAKAWKSIAAQDKDVHLVIAGPDFENTQAAVARLIGDLGLTNRVTFTGMLDSELKWSALAACHLFVLPSHSEGLSVSVLEAMGMGIPVIVTRQCNIPEVRTHQCGMVIEPDAGELAIALTELLRLPAAQYMHFGINGRNLVAQSFNWETIGAKMRSVYKWTLGGPMPSDARLFLS